MAKGRTIRPDAGIITTRLMRGNHATYLLRAFSNTFLAAARWT
jgi:hypothetical protein